MRRDEIPCQERESERERERKKERERERERERKREGDRGKMSEQHQSQDEKGQIRATHRSLQSIQFTCPTPMPLAMLESLVAPSRTCSEEGASLRRNCGFGTPTNPIGARFVEIPTHDDGTVVHISAQSAARHAMPFPLERALAGALLAHPRVTPEEKETEFCPSPCSDDFDAFGGMANALVSGRARQGSASHCPPRYLLL